MSAEVNLSGIVCSGEGSCVGGKHPDPPLDAYPLLSWMPGHPAWGSKVMTEDGKVSVELIGLAIAELGSLDAVAARFGTSADHVSQAVDYALEAGYLTEA